MMNVLARTLGKRQKFIFTAPAVRVQVGDTAALQESNENAPR